MPVQKHDKQWNALSIDMYILLPQITLNIDTQNVHTVNKFPLG